MKDNYALKLFRRCLWCLMRQRLRRQCPFPLIVVHVLNLKTGIIQAVERRGK
jgi:hypothetical protein